MTVAGILSHDLSPACYNNVRELGGLPFGSLISSVGSVASRKSSSKTGFQEELNALFVYFGFPLNHFYTLACQKLISTKFALGEICFEKEKTGK